MTENRIQPEQFEDRIIFISMSNDIHWTKDGNQERVFRILPMLLRTPEDFLQDISHSSDQELENTCMERTLTSKTVCDHSAETMMFHSRTRGHPALQMTNTLGRGSFNSKGEGNYRFTATVIRRQQSCCFA